MSTIFPSRKENLNGFFPEDFLAVEIHEEVCMKIAAKLTLLVTVLLALFGTVFAEGQGEAPGTKTTVVFYLWDDPSYPPLIEAFNKSQSSVFVDAKFIPINEYEAKISVLLAAGTEMDGYMQKRSTDIFVQNENGYIEPLDALVKKYNFDLNAISGYKDAITIDGKTLAIPFRGASYFTYFNRNIFKKAGIPTPDTYVEKGQWTWAKFIEISKQISRKLPGIYGGFLYTWGSNNVMPALQNGMKFIDKNGRIDINQSLINSFKYRYELEKAGAIMPLTETKVTKTHYSKPFYEGKVGMLIIGEWFPGFMIKGRDEKLLQGYTWNDWSLTRMPCDEKTYRTFGNPTFCHVHANSKKKDAMFKFIASLGGPQGAKIVAASGLLPAYITNDVKNEFKKILPDATALKYFTEQRTVMTQFYNKYGTQAESELGSIMESYLNSPMSDDQLVATIKARFNQVIKMVQ
jgi:multiple sugar transport system substrate-binding protein